MKARLCFTLAVGIAGLAEENADRFGDAVAEGNLELSEPEHLLKHEGRAQKWHDSTLAQVNAAVARIEQSVGKAKTALAKQEEIAGALAPLLAEAEANEKEAKASLVEAGKIAEESNEKAAKAATAKATATVAALRAAGDSYFADREKDLAEKQALAKSSAGPAQTGKSDYAKYLQGMADRATVWWDQLEVANTYSGMAVQQMRDAKRLLKRARRSAEMASKRLVPRPERLMASAHQTLAAANAKKRQAEKYYEVAEAVTNANPAWQQAADEEA